MKGTIIAREDISAVTGFGNYLIIAGDEAKKKKNYVQVFKLGSDGETLKHKRNIVVHKGNKTSGKELDIEALASDEDYVYVIGSHSKKRPRLKYGYKKNRSLLKADAIVNHTTPANLYRLTLSKKGKLKKKESLSLARLIAGDPFVGPYSHLPSKENGVDIEGLTAFRGRLYAGFRGPVLRDNYVPVMRFRFDDPGGYKMLFVQLKGGGIRSLATVKDGILLIEGPVGSGATGFHLYLWNGRDMVPGKKRKAALKYLAELPAADGSKAEGVHVTAETASGYELLIVYDGVRKFMERKVIPK